MSNREMIIVFLVHQTKRNKVANTATFGKQKLMFGKFFRMSISSVKINCRYFISVKLLLNCNKIYS
jgi:hypothetical protein